MKIFTLTVILGIWAGFFRMQARHVSYQKTDKAMVAFFQGSWIGKGQFANSKPNAAEASRWIVAG